MALSLSTLLLASGLWIVLFVGCALFLTLTFRFRREYQTEFDENLLLKEQLSEQSKLLEAADDQECTESLDIETELKYQIEQLEKQLAEQHLQLSNIDLSSNHSENLDDTVPAQQYDKLNEKYENIQTLWEGTNQELIRADANVAELLGAKTALEKERDILKRQLSGFAEGMELSDSSTMREIIVNFTEESRQLLDEIADQCRQITELELRIQDMESGGKGTAGTVVGLKRKLAEAEATIEDLRLLHG